MTDDQRPDAPATADRIGSDPGDTYSPSPEPRLDRRAHGWPAEPPPTPERWYEPPAPPVATEPVAPRAGRSTGPGTVLAAALLSAVLASGGTVLALGASGALDRPAVVPPTVVVGDPAGTRQPVIVDETSAVVEVAAMVSPAVVKITTRGAPDPGILGGVIPPTGVGSGVIYDATGWILTNRHVVEGSDSMEVKLNDGRTFTGTVYGIDTLTDLAIVKIDATGLAAAPLGNSNELKVGQLVIAIGSPLGTYSNSVTSGIVSAKGRSIVTDSRQQLNNLIQTDAAINPGNSGGPLLDANGRVVGINTAIARDSTGIGFAIPIDIARPIMEQALAGEQLARPYIGIRYETIDYELAESRNLPVRNGALIGPGRDGRGGAVPGVVPGAPADQAGLREGDIVVAIEDQQIDEEHPLDATLSQYSPGRTITLHVLRDGERLAIPVTLGIRPADL
jgi:S1-C subfamily serine protease